MVPHRRVDHAVTGITVHDAQRRLVDGHAATVVTSKLAGIRVADVMAHDCPAVEAGMTLQEFVDRELVRSGERCYAVP